MDVDPSIHPPGYLSSPVCNYFMQTIIHKIAPLSSHPKLQVVFNIAVTPWLTHAINYRRAMAHAFSHAVHVQPSVHSMVQILETTHVVLSMAQRFLGVYRFHRSGKERKDEASRRTIWEEDGVWSWILPCFFSSTVQFNHHIYNFHFDFTHVMYEHPKGRAFKWFQSWIISSAAMLPSTQKIYLYLLARDFLGFLEKCYLLNTIHLSKCMLHNPQIGIQKRYHQSVQSWWWVAHAQEARVNSRWNGGICCHETKNVFKQFASKSADDWAFWMGGFNSMEVGFATNILSMFDIPLTSWEWLRYQHDLGHGHLLTC